ncbi:MAG: nitrate reductase molybdenum cofactor assembly chaperone [Rhodospirillales bacterium]|nr:nitrate reductase molybdenum cofactor assembly chaperone [Rhodospirillales bacterium]
MPMMTLKILGALLDYPREEMLSCLPEMKRALDTEGRLAPARRDDLFVLMDRLAGRDPMEAQEDYVALFDRTRSLSLHLFEHVHGESRDRGQAMVDLLAMYEAKGLEIDVSELPDYLPLFLEFLSILPEGEALELLGEVRHILIVLAERLAKRESVYHTIFTALVEMSQAVAGKTAGEIATPAADEADLDKVWEEEEVLFGAGSAINSCPAARGVLAKM